MQQKYRYNNKTFLNPVKKKLVNNRQMLFVRPNLDYADMIYEKPFNESLKRKI